MSRTTNSHNHSGARMEHGTRWRITTHGEPIVVRAYRDQPEKLRVVDTSTRQPVLKVTHRPGSTSLPPTVVVQDLLRWACAANQPRTQGLERMCWRLTETPTGFTLSLRTRVEDPTTQTPIELPLATRGPVAAQRAHAARTAKTLLAMARGGRADNAHATPAHLAALAQAVAAR